MLVSLTRISGPSMTSMGKRGSLQGPRGLEALEVRISGLEDLRTSEGSKGSREASEVQEQVDLHSKEPMIFLSHSLAEEILLLISLMTTAICLEA